MNINKLKSNPKLPKHIAFIMDGNGRWAKKRGKSRNYGHEKGFQKVKSLIDFTKELGIKNVSMYCFSKENFKRPKQEVDYLMDIFDEMLDEFANTYANQDVRIIISGDMEDERIPLKVRNKAKQLMKDTQNKTGFVINPCIAYGGRNEIVKAVNEIVKAGERDIDEKSFEKHLYTKDLYPVDLIIRTSGEYRLSGFLTWQSTYSELYFTKKYWPAFSKNDLLKALKSYLHRNRRFGAIKE